MSSNIDQMLIYVFWWTVRSTHKICHVSATVTCCRIEKLKDSRLLSKIAKGCLLLNDCVHTFHTVDGSEIPNKHLACIIPCREWDIYYVNWLAGFLNHQPYGCMAGLRPIIQVSSLQNMMAVFMYVSILVWIRKHPGISSIPKWSLSLIDCVHSPEDR